MSFIDYDELECECCGHIGVLPDGDFDVICPVCEHSYSLIDEDEDDDEDGYFD